RTGTYAENEDSQGRFQALQKDGGRQGAARTIAPASHSDLEGQEAETETAPRGAGGSGGRPQNQAHDSVPVICLCGDRRARLSGGACAARARAAAEGGRATKY